MLSRRHSFSLDALFLGALLVACGASSSTNNASIAQDSGASPAPDAGASDLTKACDSDDASPSLPCGTLAFVKSAAVSRARNHHVTLIVPTTDGSNANLLYAIGGFNGQTSVLDKVDVAPIGSDGSLGSWTTGPVLPQAAGGSVGEYVNGVVVIAGGTTLENGVTDKAFSAVVNPDGTLAAWNPAGTIVNPRMHGGAISQGNTMWILGGFANSTVWSDIVSATISPDGTVSTWKAAGALPGGPRSHFQHLARERLRVHHRRSSGVCVRQPSHAARQLARPNSSGWDDWRLDADDRSSDRERDARELFLRRLSPRVRRDQRHGHDRKSLLARADSN